MTTATGLVRRPVVSRAIEAFFAAASIEPALLVVEGEPGIGKSTVWAAALEQARQQGFQIMSARPAATESTMAYGALADLLGGIDAATIASLPDPQRRALDWVLLRADAPDTATDQRAVGAAVLSVIDRLTDEAPVLLAIDDLHWLDPSSKHIVAFAARRLSGRVGVLVTVRTGPDGDGAASSLQLSSIDRMRNVTVQPLSVGGLHGVVSERLGRSFARPAMVRIWEVSGGNPFYAVELARGLDDQAGKPVALPSTLADLVRAKIGSVDADAQDVLLATACLASPTVELVARAIGTDIDRVIGLLDGAEHNGIVVVDGHRLRFSHPILAGGVYADASLVRRRIMHRRLAEIVSEPELRARHLALAASGGDPQTLQSLDGAADLARLRGAPEAAAELLDMAIGLGGDTPERRIRSAKHHFDAGDPAQALVLLEETIAQLPAGVLRAQALSALAFVRLWDDNFLSAADLLERAIGEAADDLAARVPMSVTMSFALVNGGRPDAAVRSVEIAVSEAEQLGQPNLLSLALGMRAILGFMRGDGVDVAGMRRALELEDPQATVPIAFRASVQNALLDAWTGHLDDAQRAMATIGMRCVENGEESELVFVAFHSVLIAIWRGAFEEAALEAEDSMERARHLNSDVPMSMALVTRSLLAAYAGRVDECRRDAADALAASRRSESQEIGRWPLMCLGFLEVSRCDYDAALLTLKPLLPKLDAAPNATEIIDWFVPDAAEAMIHLGLLDDAEQLVSALERNGRRLDRPWMLAVGARTRSMLQAAYGDVEAAYLTAQQAMVEHDRLPMPFERARTQLLLGQLHRRRRNREAGYHILQEALAAFEALDTPLWADRVRTELSRSNIGPHQGTMLTPSEQRVADLVASGMTNRDVAAALFISPKTVEANLARIYKKLRIHSRAELGRHMGRSDK